ncbi:MAG: vanadium-dependent haloperoxidase [Pyrinomonadaceae bacterium]
MKTVLKTNLTRPTAVATLLFLIAFFSSPRPVLADKVTDWNRIALTAEASANRTNNAVIGTDLAYMHIAIYDAVNAIDPRYTMFAVQPVSVPPGASQEAAAVEAAYRVLRAIMPASQAAYLDVEYAASLASIPDSFSKTDGMAVGLEAANLFLASRVGDGRNDSSVIYTPGSGVGVWIPTPPGFGAAATPWLAVMRPFAIENPSQFRAEGPPLITSQQYTDDFNETKRFGSINSSDRTQDQTNLARFYLDVTIPQEAQGLRRLATANNLSTADSARLYAQLYVSVSDALIAGWDSKLYYSFWRPVTAIRNADADGNPYTEADPTWSPLTSTPAHPEYPSAHAFISNAFTETLRQFFRTKKVKITLSSVTTGTSIEYRNTDEIGKDINDARIYAGFHFRTACIHGSLIGEKVARYVARKYFRSVREKKEEFDSDTNEK